MISSASFFSKSKKRKVKKTVDIPPSENFMSVTSQNPQDQAKILN
jgi:hypothetical protein